MAALLFVAMQSAAADSYRCGRKLIYTGDTAAEVLRVCGEPKHRDRSRESVRIDGVQRNVSVERWHYRQSGRSLERIVHFHRGRVISITIASR